MNPLIISRSYQVDHLPAQAYIEVANRCNSRCASCPLTYFQFSRYEPKRMLSWGNFRRIVDQLPHLERVVLHGIGEPLLNPELPRFVAYLKERGAWVLFNTNGILLDLERGDALVSAGLDELRVSLDAATPELYARLRGVDRFTRVVQNLKAFTDRHGGRSLPKVSLWWVAMKSNLGQLPDFVRLGAELGIGEVYMQRLVYYGSGDILGSNSTMRAQESLFSTLEQQQADLIRECEALAAQLGLDFQASGATTPHDSISAKGVNPWQRCSRPWTLMYITANGNALPCCIAPFATRGYSDIILGNVLHQPLAEVWNGQPYQNLRKAIMSKMPDPWPCQYCGVKWSL